VMGARVSSRFPMWLRLFLLSAFLSTIYSLAAPPWQSPDEPRHFEYVRLLYLRRRLVGWGDADPDLEREIIASMDRYEYWRLGVVDPNVYDPAVFPERFSDIWAPGLTHELHQPPLSYILYAVVLPLTDGMRPGAQLRWMRLISVVLGALSVCMAYWTTREAFPEDRFLQVGVPTFIALLPMHAYLAGTLNNDHLAELAGSALMLLLVTGILRGFSPVKVVGAGLLLLVGVLSKRTAIPLIPTALCAMILAAWDRYGARRVWRGIILAIGLVLLAILLTAVTWSHVREFLTSTAPSLLREIDKLVYVYALYIFRPADGHQRSTTLSEILAQGTLAYYRHYAEMLFVTFWACFGSVNVWLGKGWRVLLSIVTVGAMGGLIRPAARFGRDSVSRLRWQRACLLVFVAAVFFGLALLGVQLYLQWDHVPRPTTQARFLFPEIVPIAVLFMLGVREWAPVKHRSRLLKGWLVWMVLLNVVCLVGYLIPYYHG